jgi:DNA-binding transcriptional LysR family regulator
MDKLRAMEVFVATVDAGSFAAAAEALDLSAVMVGKHIRALEDAAGRAPARAHHAAPCAH